MIMLPPRVFALCLLLLAAQLAPDAQTGRVSPHETVSAAVDGARISVTYGRPYMKGRKIMGGLVPYGFVWRTGADEATTLVSDKPLRFGSVTVPAGTHTLFTLPRAGQWTLIINRQTGQTGLEYDEEQDLGRVAMTIGQTAAPVEQLTMLIQDTPAGGALVLRWERTELTAAFTVVP
jgi:hypothetical protein